MSYRAYNPPSGYRVPKQPFSKFGYDGNLWVPGGVGVNKVVLPGGLGYDPGTDFGALAVGFGLTVTGYFRADNPNSLGGAQGTGLALWTPVSGAMSPIIPEASATNGIGNKTAGLAGRAGIIQNATTQKGTYTAPAYAIPATTNFHRYFIVRQASGGSGATRKLLSETGDTYKLELATETIIYAYGATNVGNVMTLNTWLRGRVTYTGTTSSEWKLGNQTLATGGTVATTAPNTTRLFGDLLCNNEWLMLLECTGPKASFLNFATAADAATQTTWSSAIQI